MICQKMVDKSDRVLISMIRGKGDNDSFLEICRRYENIFYKVCQKYTPALSMSGISPQDIFDEKNCIILHCINTFKPSKKTKLGTWIGNYARYLCLNSINSRKFIAPTKDEELIKHSEEAKIVQDYFNNQESSIENYKYVLNLLNQISDKRIIRIFQLRYFQEKKMTWTDIALKMKISTQTAINLHDRGLDLIKRKIKSENISDKI